MHRDVKPSNVLVRDDGIVKLADLGIAKAIGATQITKEGSVIGTLPYMAPERLRGPGAGGYPSPTSTRLRQWPTRSSRASRRSETTSNEQARTAGAAGPTCAPTGPPTPRRGRSLLCWSGGWPLIRARRPAVQAAAGWSRSSRRYWWAAQGAVTEEAPQEADGAGFVSRDRRGHPGARTPRRPTLVRETGGRSGARPAGPPRDPGQKARRPHPARLSNPRDRRRVATIEGSPGGRRRGRRGVGVGQRDRRRRRTAAPGAPRPSAEPTAEEAAAARRVAEQPPTTPTARP